MSDSNSIDEKALLFSSWPPEELLRSVISELRQPIVDVRGFSQIIAGDTQLTSEKRKELLGYILKRLDRMEQVLEISVKALNLRKE